MTRALLEQALEALDSCTPGDYSTGHVIHPSYGEYSVNAAIEAIRAHLAQSHEEPVPESNFGNIEAPAWHDAPTAPGLWVCNLDMQAYNLPDPEIDLGGGNRWYGPIPDDGGKP